MSSPIYGSMPDMSSMPPMTGVPGGSGLSAFGGAPPLLTMKRGWGNRVAILLLIAGAAWLFWREMTRAAAIYDVGVALKKGATTTEIRWNEVAEVRLSAVQMRNYHGGGLVGLAAMAAVNAMRGKGAGTLDSATQLSVVVKSRTGDVIKLNKADSGAAQAYQEICRRVNPRLIEEAAAQLASGAPLAFGPVAISGAGIAFNKKPPIPWKDVSVVAIENGAVVAKRDGKWLSLGSMMLGLVPNVYVLTEMTRRIAGSTTRVDAAWGVGLVRVQ